MSEPTQPNPNSNAKSTARLFLPLIFAGLFMVTGICVLIFLGREKARIIGQTITDLDIQPLLVADKPIAPDDMKGKVVVLHFWGYWCSPCLKEYPGIVELQKKYQSDPSVLFLSIASKERNDDTKDALAFYTEKYLIRIDAQKLPVYHDPAEYSRVQISQLLTAGGFVYPTTLVIDGQGRVVDVWRSSIDKSTLDKAIQKAKSQSAKG
ncbi:MAG: TlpA disulfide reductase family protein [Pirellula sp.]